MAPYSTKEVNLGVYILTENPKLVTWQDKLSADCVKNDSPKIVCRQR